MPPGLNPQQQLQFILNVMGDRIASLEKNQHALQLNIGAVSGSGSGVNTEMDDLKKKVEDLEGRFTAFQQQPPQPVPQQPVQDPFDPSEWNTRTEMLAAEIQNVKELLIGLQHVVIQKVIPALLPPVEDEQDPILDQSQVPVFMEESVSVSNGVPQLSTEYSNSYSTALEDPNQVRVDSNTWNDTELEDLVEND
jgi:hypothetical protein